MKRILLALILSFIVFSPAQAILIGPSSGSSGGGGSSGSNYAYNLDPTILPHLRAAIANVKAGVGNARLCFVGDSTTFGVGGNGTQTGNIPPQSYPTFISQYLNTTYGINSHWNSFFGDGTTAQTVGVNDSRVTLGSGWTQGGSNTAGGRIFVASNTTANFSFRPITPVDTFRIYYFTGTGLGTFSANLNGGTNTNQSENATSSVAVLTMTGTLGMNTLNLNWVSGGSVGILGVEAYDSTKSWVSIINQGWPTAKSTDLSVATNIYSPSNTALWAALQCDVVFDNLGINDWNHDYPAVGTPASFQTNLQTIVTAQKSTNSTDVVILSPIPSSETVNVSTAIQAQYVAAMKAVATSTTSAFIDTFSRWQSYAISSAAPISYYQDTVHALAKGYADEAASITSSLFSAGILGAGSTSVDNIFNNFGSNVKSTQPSVSGDPTTGLYSDTASTVGVAISGVQALRVTATGINVSGVGGIFYPTNDSNGTGSSVGVGAGALSGQTAGAAGYNNTAFGFNTLRGSLSSSSVDNTAIGNTAMSATGTLTGDHNTAIGFSAMSAWTSGSLNTAVGAGALSNAIFTGSSDIAFGRGTANKITTGSNNTVIGTLVGSTLLATGTDNILVGTDATVDTASSSTNHSINIGNLYKGFTSSGPGHVVLGGTAQTTGNLASCGTTPAIAGNDNVGRITIGTGGATACVLTFANAWTTAPACVADDETTSLTARTTATTTTLTFTGSFVAADKVGYICVGY